MVSTCIVPGCKAATERKGSGISYYRLPIKDAGRCKLWLKAVNNPMYEENSSMESLKNLRVCSLHFKPEDFKPCFLVEELRESLVKKLKETAVPSVNVDEVEPGPSTASPDTKPSRLQSPTVMRIDMAPSGLRNCSVVGCSKQHRSLFTLPSEQERRTLWIHFIVNGPVPATLPKKVFVCGHHFTSDCFENEGSFNAGFASQLRLKKGSVPTIRDPLATSPTAQRASTTASSTAATAASVVAAGPSSSQTQLQAKQERVNSTSKLTDTGGVESATASQPSESPPDRMAAPASLLSRPVTSIRVKIPSSTSKRKEVACQTELPLWSDWAQLCRRSFEAHIRSKSTQTTVLTREIGVGTARASRQASQESTTMNISSKRQRLDWEDDDNPMEGSESELATNTYNRCPSCGPEADLEKAPHSSPIISNHQCIQCEGRNQWKNQVNGNVPATSDSQLTDDTNLAAQAASTNNNRSIVTDVPEIVAVIDEERDEVDETDELDDDGDMDSDEDWDLKEAIELDDDYSEESDYDTSDLMRNQLCPDCGVFSHMLRRHTCEYKIKPYSCNLCGKRFVSEAALSLHDKIHSEDYEHQCKYCNVTFKSKRDKIIHEKIHVNDRKPYKCCHCSETFSTHRGRRTHQGRHECRKITCDICGTEFVSNSALERHTLVHTGEKPYECSVCQQRFKQSNHLTSHMRLHTGERPYKCQHCDKCFNHNVSLKSHLQRCHSSRSGHEQKKPDQKASHRCDTQEDRDGEAADSEPDNGDEELATEEEEEEEEVVERRMNKAKKRTTGRPKGRPKSFGSSDLVLAVQAEGTGKDSKNKNQQIQKTKNKQCSNEETEDELSDGNQASISAEEEENTAKPANCLHSDSDFGPEDTKKKEHSNQGHKLDTELEERTYRPKRKRRRTRRYHSDADSNQASDSAQEEENTREEAIKSTAKPVVADRDCDSDPELCTHKETQQPE